ncbi:MULTISPECIES: TonB-dependent receptor domain-containing protein [unclassified Sphingomonas]|uniref:TonB-dependent receptor domain-containing protein n=1 Tax=Sphingomonas TaxID=13687 RepID=UPI0009654AC0|nr:MULTISPECIES: TonB-dependent receptor [unclassified Sphingomonas]MBN8813614.1 TonB-dependent receptor [Sphingomonas sp.]OJY52331.1 MAG: TonB-dependent receptor [Sphingomonas sp. 67-41]
MRKGYRHIALTAGSALGVLMLAQAAQAQEAQAAQEGAAATDEIVVVGTQIKGASTTAALPVSVIDANQIDATGALSGDELFRSIPQAGDVTFNEANNPQTSNAARGDVNSINLRNLGVGNTLVLLNGRRLVNHPTSQAGDGNVPVLGYNANSLPVAGIQRLEILRDGAAAIYGSDAVAGVVNTVTRTNIHGGSLDFRYGGAEGTHRREFQVTGTAGSNFAGGRGNVSLYLDYTHRTAQLAEDQPYTATDNLMSYFANDPAYAGNLTADGRATQSPWANLAVVNGPGTIRRSPGNQALTSSAGAFHTQSSANPGCLVALSADTCLGSGTRATASTLRNERFDTRPGTTVSPRINRYNSFASAHYDISDSLTAYGEAGFYYAETRRIQPPTINLNAIVIPASNYWNPFGPTTLNGQPNPNRIPNLTNVPATGLPVRLSTYRFVDAGKQEVNVTNWQSRFLGGLKGQIGSFDFDSAILYSAAQATDVSNAINMTKLQQNLALSTPDAYNPFSGGCAATPSVGDCSPASAATIDSFQFKLKRRSRTTLALADFKMSNARLLALPGGNLGIAFGIEGRRETQRDDRDPNLNGTIGFVDMVTGETNLSNVAAVSPTPSTKGHREVFSAFAELAVPVVSPEMHVPLVHRLDVQLAGRYEHYSDFGSVAKPKVAAAWDLVDGLRIRGSWSQGFRAPNLEQTNTVAYSRLNSNTDYYRCEADLRAGRIANYGACSRGISYSIFVSGNPNLKPESSTSWTLGTVLQPKFIPESAGRLTLTADFWSIKQTGIVGQFGAQNALVLDYLLRLQGSSNPNVIRAAPTADDTPVFTGTGLAPAGVVTRINDQFVNLLPQTVQGVDLALLYNVRTRIGKFDLALNGARLTKFSRDTPPAVQALFDARTAGQINAATPLTDARDLIADRGKPKWRVTGSLTWSKSGWQVGAFANYIDTVYDSNFLDANGRPYKLDGQVTFNLYTQYRFKGGVLDDTRIRIGARNLFDKQPPITADGYLGSLYSPYGRYLYMTIGKRF